jgi:hypothetical protein
VLTELLDNFHLYSGFIDSDDVVRSISDSGIAWNSPVGDLIVSILSRVYNIELCVVQVTTPSS